MFGRVAGCLSRIVISSQVAIISAQGNCVKSVLQRNILSSWKQSVRYNTKSKTKAESARQLLADSQVPFTASFTRLKRAFDLSSNTKLKEQQAMFGACLKRSLPLRENLAFENYFMDDILENPIYDRFKEFVIKDIKGSAKPNMQEIFLGVVPQVSGYGKTHLARVFTRHNKAIYLKFSDRRESSLYLAPIERRIQNLCQQIIPDVANATAEQYKELTYRAQQVIKVFFLVALNHYAQGFEAAQKLQLSDAECIAISAQLFDNECREYFLKEVENAWAQMDDGSSIEKLLKRASDNIEKHKIIAIFFDEVHALQDKFVGMFNHTSPPTASLPVPWTDELIPLRAAYERYAASQGNATENTQFANVKEAYKLPTSLTYLFVTVMEQISTLGVGCVMLTAHYQAVDFGEGVKASNDKPRLLAFTLERDPQKEIANQNMLIKSYFGIDFYDHLKKHEENSTQILLGLGSRSLYFKVLFEKIVAHAALYKPSKQQLAKVASKKNTWNATNNVCLRYASDYVQRLEATNKELYLNVIDAALFHNGYLQNNYESDIKKINASFMPTITVQQQGVGAKAKAKNRISDWWMLSHITSSREVPKYIKVIQHAHQLGLSKGQEGEYLVKMLVLSNFGKPITELAVEGSSFHKDSVANDCMLDSTSCGDIDEFGLTSLQLLADPLTHLKQRFIKVEDTVKLDGLALLRTVDGHVISTWQSKNWNRALRSADIEKSLQSIDPLHFFKQNSDGQTKWNTTRNAKHWEPIVRVIWAAGFSAKAIEQVNNFNQDEDNIDEPIVLIPFSRLPEEVVRHVQLPAPELSEDADANKDNSSMFKLSKPL